MSNTVKITDYNSVENLNDADILLINQNGENKKVTKGKLLEDVNAQIEGVNTSLNAKANISSPNFTGTMKLNDKDVATIQSVEFALLNGWTKVDGSAFVYRSGNLCSLSIEISGGLGDAGTVIFKMNGNYTPTNMTSLPFRVYAKEDNEIYYGVFDPIGNFLIRGNTTPWTGKTITIQISWGCK